jgi:hypothetical protein
MLPVNPVYAHPAVADTNASSMLFCVSGGIMGLGTRRGMLPMIFNSSLLQKREDKEIICMARTTGRPDRN